MWKTIYRLRAVGLFCPLQRKVSGSFQSSDHKSPSLSMSSTSEKHTLLPIKLHVQCCLQENWNMSSPQKKLISGWWLRLSLENPGLSGVRRNCHTPDLNAAQAAAKRPASLLDCKAEEEDGPQKWRKSEEAWWLQLSILITVAFWTSLAYCKSWADTFF